MSFPRRRPVVLILAAIVLAFLAIQGLFGGAVLAITALFLPAPQPASAPAAAALYVKVVQLVFAFIALAVSTFCAFTVVGLFRFQRWARISMILLGGVLALLCAIWSVLFLVLLLRVPEIAQTQPNPGLSPAVLQLSFVLVAVFCLIGVAVGVWWIIYFSLRSTRDVFAGAYSLDIEAANEKGRSVIEVLVMCLATIYLLSAAAGILCAFTRVPLYLLGLVVHGQAAVMLSLVCVCVFAAAGIGLFRRARLAWWAALVLNLYGFVSSSLLLLPAYQRLTLQYQSELARTFGLIPPGMPGMAPASGSPVYILSALLGMAITASVGWLLIHARFLFKPSVEVGVRTV